MSGKILVVGSLNMDLVVNAPRHPQIGETILGGRFATFPGGKGANQAVAAARMGAHVSMIGRVGRDGFGEQLLKVARQDGIDTRYISQDQGEATGIALITVDSQGRNTIVVASGANLALTPQHLHAARSAFQDAQVLVTQLENPLDTVSEAISLAAQHGLQIILNPAPAQALSPQLLAQVDYFIPNEREAMQIGASETLEDATQKLLGMGLRNLIITLGEQGVLVINQDSRTHIPAYPVQALDTVAAGDAFVGAFAAGLAEGMAPEQAVRWGNAAAAISVTRPGAQPSLPLRKEVEQFLGDAV
jgi:ribokinase